ncbi:winged helix-turn-helix domain-containing protein [Vibrio taketomensis]|uniref:winged helix-turn-helix domain-containing protein n=1 Tax=Vibrio taketomensis TaxID=2572923 RepID=UPI0013896008|nr:winged helix-turn-helix domain-containing protein [Vibrio taketomensis]
MEKALNKTRFLTPKQYQLLKCLYDAHPNVLQKEEIIARVWGTTHTSPESLPQLIIRTRQAIGDSNKKILVNELGVGYSLHFEVIADEVIHDSICPEKHKSDGQIKRKPKATLWHLTVGLLLALTAYNTYEAVKAIYFATDFRAVHHATPYPHVKHDADGKTRLTIGKSECTYEKTTSPSVPIKQKSLLFLSSLTLSSS